jgi:hypothetical protein
MSCFLIVRRKNSSLSSFSVLRDTKILPPSSSLRLHEGDDAERCLCKTRNSVILKRIRYIDFKWSIAFLEIYPNEFCSHETR